MNHLPRVIQQLNIPTKESKPRPADHIFDANTMCHYALAFKSKLLRQYRMVRARKLHNAVQLQLHGVVPKKILNYK